MIPLILAAKIYILSTLKIAAIIYDKSVFWSLFDQFNFFFSLKFSQRPVREINALQWNKGSWTIAAWKVSYFQTINKRFM